MKTLVALGILQGGKIQKLKYDPKYLQKLRSTEKAPTAATARAKTKPRYYQGKSIDKLS
jgi:hypothetical protein